MKRGSPILFEVYHERGVWCAFGILINEIYVSERFCWAYVQLCAYLDSDHMNIEINK